MLLQVLFEATNKIGEAILPKNLVPTWLWIIIAILAVLLTGRLAKVHIPREEWFSAEEMEDLFDDSMDSEKGKTPLITGPKVHIYDDKKDVYLIQEVFEDGEKWFVWSPVRRGAWKFLNLWWFSLLGMMLSCFIFIALITVPRLLSFCQWSDSDEVDGELGF